MTMTRSVLGLGFLILPLSLAATGTGPATGIDHGKDTPTEATFDVAENTDLVIMESPTGHVLVQASIGSEDPGWFIFDTGASVNTISTALAREIGAELVRETSVQGSSGSAPAQEWRIESLRVGPVSFQDPILIGTDLAFLEQHFGVPVSGIIGTPALARVVAEIDLSAPRIALHEPRSYSRAEIDWEPLTFSSNMPALPARFEGRDGLFIIDLGSARSGIFYRRATDRLGLLDGRETSAVGGRGVGGENVMLAGTLEWFELGGRRYESVEFYFSRATSGFWAESEATGNLGQELIRDFVLILDYPRQRFALIPHRKPR